MSQPIRSKSTNDIPPKPHENCMAGFFKEIGNGFYKAFTPCEVYCKEQLTTESDVHRIDQLMRSCLRECKDFQRRFDQL